MLSNNTFLKTRILRPLDDLIFVEKNTQRARAMHAQNKQGLYTGWNFKQNICKKYEWKLGTLFTIMV